MDGQISVSPSTVAARIDALCRAWPVERVLEKLEELANAQRVYVTKDGDTYETPDYNTQLSTTKFIWETVVGRNVPRQQEDTPPPPQPIEEKLKSRIYREALRRALDAADAAEAAAIEVESEEIEDLTAH
jgi:hypothetical protein